MIHSQNGDLKMAHFFRAFAGRLRKVTLPLDYANTLSVDMGESLKRAVRDIAEAFADALIEESQKP